MKPNITKTTIEGTGTHSLYRIVFSNGKSYYGITKNEVEKRIKQHIGAARRGNDNLLYRAIRKYNYEFSVEKVRQNLSKQQALFAEKIYVSMFDTFGKNGYNAIPGGASKVFRNEKSTKNWYSAIGFNSFYAYEVKTQIILGPFNTIKEFTTKFNGFKRCLISRCLSNKTSAHNGVIFYRETTDLHNKLKQCQKHRHDKFEVFFNGTSLGIWNNVTKFSKHINMHRCRRAFSEALCTGKSYKNYVFKKI